jgi:hypothetical protein
MRRIADEDGAVAVIVAILLFLLVGVGALAVDVGNLYWERRQLQTAADAAAFSAAQELVSGGAEAAAFSTAREFAHANNSRGAFVRPDEFKTTANSVTVTARTGSLAAEGELKSILAGVLGFQTYATSARATVVWSGGVGGGETIPIAVCDRAWQYWTNLRGLPTSPEHYLSFGGSAAAPASTCNNPSFDTYNGGFGFLSRNAECRATTRLDESTGYTWVKGNTGNNPQDPQGSTCTTNQMYQLLRSIIDEERVALIPIFDAYNNKTNEFRLIGYGAFRLTGYEINAAVGDSYYKMAKNECGQAVGPPNNASCLKGYFTEFVSLDAAAGWPGLPNFGASVIRLVE